ncbi:MAG: hypothetical protein JWR26_3378 [Pedosphaera sp.]|nr:hypothetical protein [Pedosphaera sp.]
MKRKQLILLIAGLVVAAGTAWLGRASYQAWHGLITLNVRNAPLADVIKSLERQTWSKIRYDSRLNTQVTLDVKNMPLPQVLDRLAEQAGAAWSTDFVVYDSNSALRKLKTVFKGEAQMAAVGWTNLSSAPAMTSGPGADEDVGTNLDGMVLQQGGAGTQSATIKLDGNQLDEVELRRRLGKQLPAGAGMSVVTEDRVVEAVKEALKDGKGGGGKIAIARSAGPGSDKSPGVTFKTFAPSMHAMVKTPDGRIQSLPDDLLVPERLLAENALTPKLDLNEPMQATADDAEKAAKKAHASWTIYYTLRKLPFGMNVRLFHDMEMKAGETGGPGGIQDIQTSMKNHVQQQKQDFFTKLTPEQRVERARSAQAFKQEN